MNQEEKDMDKQLYKNTKRTWTNNYTKTLQKTKNQQ